MSECACSSLSAKIMIFGNKIDPKITKIKSQILATPQFIIIGIYLVSLNRLPAVNKEQSYSFYYYYYYILLGVGYTGVKNTFLAFSFLQRFLLK